MVSGVESQPGAARGRVDTGFKRVQMHMCTIVEFVCINTTVNGLACLSKSQLLQTTANGKRHSVCTRHQAQTSEYHAAARATHTAWMRRPEHSQDRTAQSG
jgi:hypothetical protein